MVFQDPYTSLDPRQKVGDILMEALEIHGIGSKSQRMEAALEILEKVGLRLEHFYRYPHEFSGEAEAEDWSGPGADFKSENHHLR